MIPQDEPWTSVLVHGIAFLAVVFLVGVVLIGMTAR